MATRSVASGSYAGSVASSRSSTSRRARKDVDTEDGQDLMQRRSSFEAGIFGVLFTLSKENSDTRINLRWVLVKTLIDAWQLFTAVISPGKQGWAIKPNGMAWAVVGVLNFQWLGSLGYGAYLAVLYGMVTLLAVNVGICVWVAWCFKEQKFPVVWPIHVLRVFSSVFFQAFDVTSLSVLQLGISCRYTGFYNPKMHLDLFPRYSCMATPHLLHAAVSAVSLVIFVAIALLLNMAEVEVNPKSKRPLALGHSGAEVMVFAIKVLLTLVDVFIGWKKVAACVYLALCLALSYQYIRWNPNLVAWMNYLKSGVAVSVTWAAAMLVLLVFHPGAKSVDSEAWAHGVTVAMLAGLGPAFVAGAAMSWAMIRHTTLTTLKHLKEAKPDAPLEDVCRSIDDPRDVELVARCCRVWKDTHHLDYEAVHKAHEVIKAGMAMFPTSPYMILLHANFMIDVLGINQSGHTRIEEALKLGPSLMCRFIMFVRQQQATQQAAGLSAGGGGGIAMDLLGYVEYQRRQKMVVRFHREALQAMCNFWRALDASSVSFTHLSKALGKIETSVSQAQTAYRVVLQSYGNNPKLVRLYGRFLQTVKNDPWAAAEYFAEADRLEETKGDDNNGPKLPDGTPLGRMDELATAVLVLTASGEIQMANRQTYHLFGYNKAITTIGPSGAKPLEGKPLSAVLAPHCARWLTARLAQLVTAAGGAGSAAATAGEILEVGNGREEVVVGMHYDRLAFAVKLALTRASGVGEDSTFIAVLEPIPPLRGVSCLWIAQNGTIAACDPHFQSAFGWKASEVNGGSVTSFLSMPSFAGVEADVNDTDDEGIAATEGKTDTMTRLLLEATVGADKTGKAGQGLQCLVAQKYDETPACCAVSIMQSKVSDTPMFEVRLRLNLNDRDQLMVTNRKGHIVHASSELAAWLKDASSGLAARRRMQGGQAQGGGPTGPNKGGPGGPTGVSGVAGADSTVSIISDAGDPLAGYTLYDFLPMPWRDMHPKFLKDTTSLSPPSRSPWSCRKSAPPGQTLEMRNTSGKTLYMRVAVSTTEMGGELLHVTRMAKSSLEAALSERRLRLSVSGDGLITAVVGTSPPQLFGLEPSQVVGRGLWEVVEDLVEDAAAGGRPQTASKGPRMLTSIINRSVANPGFSWRVRVSPPLKARSLMSDLDAAARHTAAKPAVMQLTVQASSEGDGGRPSSLLVDLWPATSLTGLLEVDGSGRILGVLEDQLRPAGLLFGLPSSALVGGALEDLLALPPGRSTPADLLMPGGTKKSSIKANKKDSGVKVGPVHVLQAAHVDGRPVALELQVVGRPGLNQPATVILRPRAAPLLTTTFASLTPLLPADPASPFVMPADAPQMPLRSVPASPRPLNGAVPNMFALPPRAASATGMTVAAAVAAAAAAGDRGSVPGSVPMTPNHTGAASLRLSASAADELMVMLEERVQRASGGAAGQAPAAPVAIPSPSGLSPRRATDAAIIDIPTSATFALPGPPPPDLLPLPLSPSPSQGGVSLSANSLPVPGVTPGRASSLAARSRLSEMVKQRSQSHQAPPIAGEGLGSPLTSVAGSGRLRPRGSSRFGRPGVGGELSPLSVAAGAKTEAEAEAGGALDEAAGGVVARAVLEDPTDPRAPDSDADSVDSIERDVKKAAAKKAPGSERVSAWVASKGAFYQTVEDLAKESDDESPDEAARAAGPGNKSMNAFVTNKDAKATQDGGYDDDDARSEGGASATSGQSGTAGAESGRRFKRLAKLMISTQAQKIQERLRRHAAATVGLIGLVHVVCFVLVVISIGTQRDSMALLGRNGEAQRYMQQIMTDVRSLDVLSQNISVPWLYTTADMNAMVARTEYNANQIKVRMNAILDGNHGKDSQVMRLLFFERLQVWDGVDAGGNDLTTNITLWEAITRFYSMSMDVVQNHRKWVAQGVHVSETPAGRFVLGTGPDLYSGIRQVMDALLFETVANVHSIDNLQLIFLSIEGCAVSCAAAIYLAHLLRAVSAQRLDLYRMFLMIPVGLTRVLASQNTVMVDEDEDDEDDLDDDIADKAAVADAGGNNNDEDGKGRPRARSVVVSEIGALGNTENGYYGNGGGGGGGGQGGGNGLTATRRGSGRGLLSSPSAAGGGGGGGVQERVTSSGSVVIHVPSLWDSVQGWFGRPFGRGKGAAPLLQQVSAGGGVASFNATTSNKRVLKNDSHETIMMLTPFLVWSALVIGLYITAVVRMKDMVDAVAIHSVVNRISARAYQAVFFAQELAVVEDPASLPAHRASLTSVMGLTRDAWLTLQLGADAHLAGASADTERFPLVRRGLAYASPEITELFYSTGRCVRLQDHPCPDPSYRFYHLSRLGLDAMMGQFLLALQIMANNKTDVARGLQDEYFDLVYNVGIVDLVDGTISMRLAHYNFIVKLFNGILLLHIVLFLLLFVIFSIFVFFLLNPLLKRIIKERRRIAELMSQLPMELDVEKMVARALGTTSAPGAAGASGGGGGTGASVGVANDGNNLGDQDTGTSKWRAILRTTSNQTRQSIGNQSAKRA